MLNKLAMEQRKKFNRRYWYYNSSRNSSRFNDNKNSLDNKHFKGSKSSKGNKRRI